MLESWGFFRSDFGIAVHGSCVFFWFYEIDSSPKIEKIIWWPIKYALLKLSVCYGKKKFLEEEGHTILLKKKMHDSDSGRRKGDTLWLRRVYEYQLELLNTDTVRTVLTQTRRLSPNRDLLKWYWTYSTLKCKKKCLLEPYLK